MKYIAVNCAVRESVMEKNESKENNTGRFANKN